MKTKPMIYACLMAVALTSCGGSGSEKNLVTVNIDNPQEGAPKVVALQVVNDNVIRVRATTADALPKKKESLIIVPQKNDVKFSVEERLP